MTAPDWNAIEETLLAHAGAIALECRDAARRSPSQTHDLAVRVTDKGAWDGTEVLPLYPDAEPKEFAPDLVVLAFRADDQASAVAIGKKIRAWGAHERARPRCRDCGCTDEEGCAEGCWWVERDLCSSCASEKGEAP